MHVFGENNVICAYMCVGEGCRVKVYGLYTDGHADGHTDGHLRFLNVRLTIKCVAAGGDFDIVQ